MRDIFTNMSILGVFLLIVGQIFKKSDFDNKQPLKTQALMGMVFGILGIVLMLFTIRMSDNIIIDLRHISIICAGIMGGPLVPILAAIMIAFSRILIFGLNAASVTAFVVALLIGAEAAYISSMKLSRLNKYLLMLVCFMLISNTAFVNLIKDKARLMQTLAYYWHINMVGAVLAYFTCQYIISANAGFRTMAYYRMTADNLLDMISTNKPGGEVIFATPSVKQLLGYTPEEFIGTSSYEYIHPEDIDNVKEATANAKATGDDFTRVFRVRRKDGKYIWVETSVKVIRNDDGTMKEMVCVTRDNTTRMKIEQELRVSNARLKAVFENAGTGIVLRDCDENLIDANPAYLDMVGYTKEEVEHLSDIVHEDDYEDVHKLINDMVAGVCSSDKSEIRYVDSNDQVKYVEVTSTLIPGTEYVPASIVRVVNDITELKRKEEELIKAKSDADKLAATDFLTGVLTRRAFSERLEAEFHRAAREKAHICLVMVDVDHFKAINDVHGHQVGDLVLQKFTKCVAKVCRAYDFIGRQGGEEFIICLPDTGLEQGRKIAERMRKAVEELKVSLLYLREPIKLTASFGVASVIPEKGETVERLIKQADRALYDAKEAGRNKVCDACEVITN